YVCRDIPSVLKVLLTASQTVHAQRIGTREGISPEQADQETQVRQEKNIKEWKRIYGAIDFYDRKYYDLVIDTSDLSEEEIVEKVLDKLKS
ncbi:MAG: cytidylate kinase family protein, partial [Candidatus Roizmanbacteria bacterium]